MEIEIVFNAAVFQAVVIIQKGDDILAAGVDVAGDGVDLGPVAGGKDDALIDMRVGSQRVKGLAQTVLRKVKRFAYFHRGGFMT